MPWHTALSSQERSGFTYLEVQVAFVLFALALSGVGPLVVMYARQTTEIERRLEKDTTQYLVPSDSEWARRLGAAATLSTNEPDDHSSGIVTLIDNTDSGFSYQDVGSFDTYIGWFPAAYQNFAFFNRTSPSGDRFHWTFHDLPAGYYEFFVTYPAWSANASNAEYRVYDGDAYQGSETVNQTNAPHDALYDGQQWESIGVYAITHGWSRVQLRDNGNNFYVAGDAVRIEKIKNDIAVLSIEKSIDSEGVTVTVSVTENVP